MRKSRENRNSVYESTIAIDGWILEHITFFQNEWFQNIQIGSHLIQYHQSHEEPDVIGYTSLPNQIPSNEDDFLFIIEFGPDSILIRLSSDRKKSVRLTMQSPDFFDHLESIVWNIRLLDYIKADLIAITENIQEINLEIVDHREDAFRRIGFLKQVYEFTGEMESKVRRYTTDITNNPNRVAWPRIDNHRRAPIIEPEDDDYIPF